MSNPNPSPETRFKPGNPGGPGRKPGSTISLTAKLRAILEGDEFAGVKIENGKTVADVFLRSIMKNALAGKFPYAKEIFDRMDGKVTEKYEVTDARGVRDLAEEIQAAREARLAERNGSPDRGGDPGLRDGPGSVQ